MTTYRDQAVVLRTHKLGEADRIITALTRLHGKVRAVARGVRRTSSRFGGRLEPFSHVDVQFVTGRSLDIVTQVETIHAFDAPLRADYPSFTAGTAMVETADRIVSIEKEPAGPQYRLLIGALNALGAGDRGPASVILDSYLIRAMAIAGYAPVLASCARCGTKGCQRWFSPELGGMVCDACRPPYAMAPSEGAWAMMGALLAGDWSVTQACSPTDASQASGMISAFTTWHLNRGLRSLPMVERMP